MTDLKELCAELICGDDSRAEIAAIHLPEFGKSAFEAVCNLFTSPDSEIRWWAIRALAGFDTSQETTSVLLKALEDESDEVRQAAALALCHRPDPLAIGPLVEALNDPDLMTAKLASNALVQLGNQVTPALLKVLNTGSQNAKLEALRALAEIETPQSIPGLMKAVETDSALMQYWAGLGLENLGTGMVYLKP